MRKFPFLRLALLLALGILIADYFHFSLIQIKVIMISLIPLLGIMYYSTQKDGWWNYIFGISISLSIVFLGITVKYIKNGVFIQNAFENTNYEYYKIKVSSFPIEKKGYFLCEVKIVSGKDSQGILHSVYGKSKVQFVRNISEVPKIGNEYVVRNKFKAVNGQIMPGSFNYAQYLARKNIYKTAYLGYKDVVFVKREIMMWDKYSSYLRNYIIKVIDVSFKKNDHIGLLHGLLLGDKSELSKDTYNAFARSGTMHVLAVSGLHVGIIFVILTFFIRLIRINERFKVLSVVIVLMGLWTYALVTGFSVSVNRAALMFSFMYIGKVYNKNGHVINNLFAASFFLLLINPNFLFQVGFQLSISAVLSIVLFANKIEGLLKPKNWVLKKIWLICSVSIAAQLGTSIVAIYYFHHFPLFFLFSNIIIVPTVLFLLMAVVVLLLVSKIPIISVLVVFCIKQLLGIIIFTASQIEKLPFSVISNIHVNIVHIVAVFFLLVSLYCFFNLRRKTILYFGLGIMLVSMAHLKQSLINRPKIIFGSLNSESYLVHHNKDSLNAIIFSNRQKGRIQSAICKFAISNNVSSVQINFCCEDGLQGLNVILVSYWKERLKKYCNLSEKACLIFFKSNTIHPNSKVNLENMGFFLRKIKPRNNLEHWVYLN